MRAACLIPATRPSAHKTAESAASDGWDPIIEWDPDHTGPCATRNRLLARAEGYDLIRYADDDDLVLPHLQALLPLFEDGVDLVYTDFIRVDPHGYRHYQRFAAGPAQNMRCPPDCWGWIATADALKRAGFQWQEETRVVEGYFAFLALVRAGLKMRYLPLPAYEYHMGLSGLHASKDAKAWYQRYLEVAGLAKGATVSPVCPR